MRLLAVILLLVLVAAGLAGCSSDRSTEERPPTEPPEPPDGDLQEPGATYWWNDQVFYEVFVRSFYDADGDGIGDLQGLIQKLDYLNDGDPLTDTDLGVTALWLMPIAESPSYHGYDATDYRTVEPDYGSNADFQQLMAEAHARGITVIVDYVMNHCSTQHPWFTASVQEDPTYGDWFIWRDDNPGWQQPWGGGQVFHYNSTRGQHYYGVFWGGMPDLNYGHAAVKQEMFDTADFWLNTLGADGFRLDGARYMVEEDGVLADTDGTLALWSDFRLHLDTVAPDAFVVGEVWTTTSAAAAYVDAGLHTVFEFDLASALVGSAGGGEPSFLATITDNVIDAYPYHQYSTFLTNHDQERVYSQLGNNVGPNKVAAATLLTLPGVPFLFYGEEVGMASSGNHEDVRRPMQWTAGANAGFTTGTPWNEVGTNYATHNVETMAADDASLWNHYRRLVQARAASPALQRGTYHQLTCSTGQVYAFLRHHESQAVVAVHNYQSGNAGGVTISAAESQLAPGVYVASDLISGDDLGTVTVGDGGALDDWSPVSSLAGYVSLLVQLVPQDAL